MLITQVEGIVLIPVTNWSGPQTGSLYETTTKCGLKTKLEHCLNLCYCQKHKVAILIQLL